MKKISFLSLLLFWPVLCLGADQICASSSRTLFDLPKERFVSIARNYIREKKVFYSFRAQNLMHERGIGASDIEYALRYPLTVKTRPNAGPNEYHIMGLTNKDGNQVRVGISFVAQGGGQLVITTVAHFLAKDRIPLSKADFIPFIGDFIEQGKLTYADRVQLSMRGQSITTSDVEYVLKSPVEVGNKKNMQNHTPDSRIYINGVGRDGNLLRVGIASIEGKRIVVTSVRRVLDDQIPLLKEDFIRFVSDYLGAGKKIIYTRNARERMREFTVSEYDVGHMLRHPVEIIKRPDSEGYYVIGQGVGAKSLRLLISFDGRIRLITIDTPMPHMRISSAATNSPRKEQIPISKADFMRFMSDYIEQGRRPTYFARARQGMSEGAISEDDVEHILKSPTKVGSKTIVQNNVPDSRIYIMGQTVNGNPLHIEMTLRGRQINIVSVNRILDDQIPVLKQDFIRFTRDYFNEEKRIIYTPHSRLRMGELSIGEDDVEYVLKHPIETVNKPAHNGKGGYSVMGRTVDGRPLRLLISFDGRIFVVTMDMPFTIK